MPSATIKVVAVTGASGFIGAHIVKCCLERGYDVNGCVCAAPLISTPRMHHACICLLL